MVAFAEQLDRLRLDDGQILGMNGAPPEIRTFQVFPRLVAEHVLDVLTDEGRREIARGLVTVDHRRHRSEQVQQSVLGGDCHLAQLLAGRDVAPGPHHLERFAGRVTDEVQIVADPAVAAVLLAEAVFVGEMADLDQPIELAEDARTVVGWMRLCQKSGLSRYSSRS